MGGGGSSRPCRPQQNSGGKNKKMSRGKPGIINHRKIMRTERRMLMILIRCHRFTVVAPFNPCSRY